MGKSVCFLLVLVCFFALFGAIISGVSSGAVTQADDDVMQFGVNYFSTHNHYEPYYLSDEDLDCDFSLFESQGLKYVTLAIIWSYHEPQVGEYNEAALDDIIRVCGFASKYDLRVIINFYTMMSNNSWTMPQWLSPYKFEAVFVNETARQSWLNFLDHCASRLNNVDSIWSWHMMNEPARGSWACDVSVDAYLDLWVKMKAVFKSYSDRPVSVRFAAQVFDSPNHFNNDPRILGLLDYLSLNWYEYYCSYEVMTRIVVDAQGQTRVFISEFGSKSDDDLTQAVDFAKYIRFFQSLNLQDCVAWMWRADHDSPNPSPPGFAFNLAKTVNANPRPAFCVMDLNVLQAKYVLHVDTLGNGKTNATGVHSFCLGDRIIMQATEYPDWVFSHWITNVIPYKNANPFVFHIFRNYSVTATFSLHSMG